jgi:hypothetical protein
MTIETKYLIGLLLLMGIGSFMCSFLGTDNSWNNLSTSATEFADSFTADGYKGLWAVAMQSKDFVWALLQFFGACIFWNFSFFDGFEFVQILLTLINIAILAKMLVDFYKMLKPFGS